jgi:hypothetical protein
VSGKPFYSTIQYFNDHNPIDRKTVKLSFPETLPLHILNTGISETCTTNSGTISYQWEAENQPAIKQEESLPPWWTFNPTLFISAGNWEEYTAQLKQKLGQAEEHAVRTLNLAEELTKNISSPLEKVRILRNWVAKNIRLAGPDFTALPLSAITPPDQTLTERYGNQMDRMLLLHTLLQATGISSEYILSGGIPLIPEASKPLLQIPSRSSFNTLLLKLPMNGSSIYLDGSSQYAQLGATAFQNRPCLHLGSAFSDTISIPENLQDQSRTLIEMNLQSDGLMDLTESSFAQGTAFEKFHRSFAEITPEKRRRFYLELLSAISQSARATSPLVTDYTTYPGQMKFSLLADRYAVRDANYLYLTLPGQLGKLLQYRSATRTLPLEWDRPIDVENTQILVLPDDFEPAILPKDFSWDAPCDAGRIRIQVEYDPLPNALLIHQEAHLKPAIIPAEKFPEIIRAARQLAHPSTRTLLLKKRAPAPKEEKE